MIFKMKYKSAASLIVSVGSIQTDSCPILNVQNFNFSFESIHEFDFPVMLETSLHKDLVMSCFDDSDFLS